MIVLVWSTTWKTGRKTLTFKLTSGNTPPIRWSKTLCTKWNLILGHFIGYKANVSFKFGIILKIGTTSSTIMKIDYVTRWILIFRDIEPWRQACLKRTLAYFEMLMKVDNACIPKKASFIHSKKSIEKEFSTQWLSFCPKDMISSIYNFM